MEGAKKASLSVRSSAESATKQREQRVSQLQALVAERRAALERLRVECEALRTVEAAQNELIEQLILQQ